MTKASSGIILAGVMVACTVVVEAQECPASDLPETATANVTDQGSCQLRVQGIFEDVQLMSLECADSAPSVASGVYAANPETGVCTWHIKIETGSLVIAEEGEEYDVGRGFGMNEDVIPGDPQATCEAAIARGAILSNSVEVLSVSATNVQSYPGQQPHTHFTCSGMHVVNIGYLAEMEFNISGGRLYTVVSASQERIDSDVTYYADLEQYDSGEWVDNEARMHTSSARNAHPAIVRVEP